MKRLQKRRLSFLLALILVFTSLQPAFDKPVYAEPETVSASSISTDASVSSADVSENNSEGVSVSDDESTEPQGAVSDAAAPETVSTPSTPSGNETVSEDEYLYGEFDNGFEFGTGGLEDEFEIIDHPEENTGEQAAGAYLPSKYNADLDDPSTMIDVAPVRNQGSSGLCWMFGALSSVEANLLKKYNIDKSELDLSEKYSAWWLFHKSTGSLGGMIDDDIVLLKNTPKKIDDINRNMLDEMPENGYIERGGNNWLSMSGFTSWKGIVDENDDNTLQYNNQRMDVMMAVEPYLYNTKTYSQKYQVQDVDLFAYPLKGLKRDELKGAIDSGKLDIMKQHIMEYRSLAGSMNTRFFDRTNTYSYDPGEPYPIEKDKNRYSTTTHLVTYVGWDDTIKAENFSNSKNKNSQLRYYSEDEFTPPGDGAWICKNSWGDGSGKNGFFYVSYYDGSLRSPYNSFAGYNVVLKDKELGGETFYDNNYQYNGIFTRVPLNREDGNAFFGYGSKPLKLNCDDRFGAVYTAQTDEILKAVGITTREENLKFDIYINTNSQNDAPLPGHTEKNGWKDASSLISYTVPHAGFHTIKLQTPVGLNKGERFLVDFVMKKPEGGQIVVQEGTDPEKGRFVTTRRTNYNGYKYYIGDEYYYKKNSGYSIAASNGSELGYTPNIDYDIKAFTENDRGSSTGSYLEFYSNYNNMDVQIDDEVNMAEGLIFEPVSHDGIYDSIVSWNTSNPEILENVDNNGTFLALSEGSAVVTVKTVSGISASASVNVVPREPVYDINLTQTDYPYTGYEINVSENLVIISDNEALDPNDLKGLKVYVTSVSLNDGNETETDPNYDINVGEKAINVDLVSGDRLLKSETFAYNITPIDLNDPNKIIVDNVKDEYTLSSDEIKPDVKLFFKTVSPNGQEMNLALLSYNKAASQSVYDYDYVINEMDGDYRSVGMKYMYLYGNGNFTGSRYVSWRIKDIQEKDDPTLEENGVYVSRLDPQVVEYNGNKHVREGKKKAGYSDDLHLFVKYHGNELIEGRDYKLSYYNNKDASTRNNDPKKEPYVLVTGLGKFTGLNAKRYFGIAPAVLNEDNTAVTGLKGAYYIDPSNPYKDLKIDPKVSFSFTDGNGKNKTNKLKKAVYDKKTGTDKGDYKLKYYKFEFPKEEHPEGQDEDVYLGEWISVNEIRGSDEEDYYLCVAQGIGNYTGTSVEIIPRDAYPDVWPGAESQFVVSYLNTCPGKGVLKGTGLNNVKVKEEYRKLSDKRKSLTVDDIGDNTTVDFTYKNAQGKKEKKTVTNKTQDLTSYVCLYDSNKREIFEVTEPGTYTMRIMVIGTLKNGTIKGQYSDQVVVGVKEQKLKITSGMKLKSSDFKLEYLQKDTWKTAKALKLNYTGDDTSLRITKNGKDVNGDPAYILENAENLTKNSFPGKYTVILKGTGAYAGSKLSFSFRRNNIPLKNVLNTGDGKFTISASQAADASVFGAMPKIHIRDKYVDDETDVNTSIDRSYGDLDFTGSKNTKTGTGQLKIKANAYSPYTGTVTMDYEIAPYDLSARQNGKIPYVWEASSNAAENANKIFAAIDDTYSATEIPNVRLYQYDQTGMFRKEIKTDKNYTKTKDGSDIIIKIESDRDRMIKFPYGGVTLKCRESDKKSKA
ncbi:MAG: hypothetical protein K5888_08050, partial [Lachnospiraceae bacterium]|nr:hypothetical protein [Lachnospiraceae bacterium]